MEGGLDTRIQIFAVLVTALAFMLVLELVRRRRLVERYALLWMIAAVTLVVLAVWRDLLNSVADLIGVADPPNAIFLLAFAVVLTLLLHFSVAVSRLSDETKILAQEVARLDEQLRAVRGAAANGSASAPDDRPDGGERGAGEPAGGAGRAPGGRAQERSPSSATTADQ